jgi:4-hydroxybenzoate polyprenyltransferase
VAKVRDWLELVRIPNFPSVPGDPLAGFVLAAPVVVWRDCRIQVLVLIGVVLLVYAAGMILNDVADFQEDSRERPGRPMASGRIGRGVGSAAAVFCSVVALLLSAWLGIAVFLAVVLLLMLVLLYDFGRAKWLSRRVGFLVMGSCRGMSLLVGAVAAGARPSSMPLQVWIGAAVITLYITGVSVVAVDEVQRNFLSRHVGLLIRLLIVVQAGLCCWGGAYWLGGAVLLGLPLSAVLGRSFYAS